MEGVKEQTSITEVLTNNKFISSENLIEFSNVSIKLTRGLLSIYQNPLEHIQKELKDLTSKQQLCISQIQFENKKLCDIKEDVELNNLFLVLEIYQKKLFNIKREMLIIHKRIFKLKKRALQFQQIKQKEAEQNFSKNSRYKNKEQ